MWIIYESNVYNWGQLRLTPEAPQHYNASFAGTMMQSAHSPMPTQDDDPIRQSSSNMSELALDSENYTNASTTSASAATPPHAPSSNSPTTDDNADPWAVLAAAAGTSPHPNNNDNTNTPPTITATEQTQPSLSHAEGEVFSMPTTAEQQPTNGLAALGSQIQSSAATIGHVLSSKIREVDAKHGVSTKVQTTKHNLNEQYHISEKWNEFQTNVWTPVSTKTVEKTREVTQVVGERVAPMIGGLTEKIVGRAGKSADQVAPERDGEGGVSLPPPNSEQHVDLRQRWGSVTSAVSTKWQSATAVVGEWKEEHMKKMDQEAGPRGDNQSLEVAKEKLAGAKDWVSQKLVEAAERRGSGGGMEMNEKETRRLDSDGIPSSFFKK
ncbi:predicted protein [Thalassiosira pseudonana CCMP1335]|uniref:Uncharacterized protein n=1 Tax=Thalassiosira pseudonana TaxID=35128 RepID=B8BZI0_THAPS|nr:predicted protein [Thalassiosira pseudonana CCMP1335]EED93359.1 predicted protein [Thalassiosira pseudonana CCMP1335]